MKVETAYEYLEIRFGKEFRVIGSLSFIIFYTIRIAIILYLPVLALSIPLLLISVFIFVGMGSGLYLFFKYSARLPEDIAGNAILPYFVINYIPKGLSGLVIAAIFAATQSTVSSSLNSISVCITSDLIKVLPKNRDENFSLRVAKSISWAGEIFNLFICNWKLCFISLDNKFYES